MKTKAMTPDFYAIQVQDCVVVYSTNLEKPRITTVANASWIRWPDCGAEVLIVGTEIHLPIFPRGLSGWFEIMRKSDKVEIASA